MNDELFADEIRRRERARRRKGPVWTVCSFVLHIALFALIILLTPAKSLIFEPKDNKKDAAKDLSADRIEDIAEDLSQVRINELLEQILAMQAVLHNMDMMKEELAKSYDSFAEKTAKTAKEELKDFIDETERNQIASTNAQAIVRAEIAGIVAVEKQDYRTDAVHGELSKRNGQLMTETGEKTNTAQGNAVNSLDKLQVRAEFVGYQKTAETAAKFLEAQAEAARMQNQVQTDVGEIAEGLFNVYYCEKWHLPNSSNHVVHCTNRKAALEKQVSEVSAALAATKEKMAKDMPAKDAEIAELVKKEAKIRADYEADMERQKKELAAADDEIAALKKKLEALK